MNLLSAFEIKANYPDNILIVGAQFPETGKWTSLLYRMKDERIHKLMLSFDSSDEFQGWDSEAEAIAKMEGVVKIVIQNVNDYELKAEIDKLTHFKTCKMWRTGQGNPAYFDNTNPISKYFSDRLFKHFGGFTPEISKQIGW